MTAIVLAIVAILILCDAYVVFGAIGNASWWIKTLFLLPTIVYGLVIARMFLGHDYRMILFNIVIWITLCFVIPLFLFTLISLLGKGAGLIWHGSGAKFNAVAICVGLLTVCIALYSVIFGWRRLTVESVTIESPKIPVAFDGYRIVQLSDFHIGTYAFAPSAVDRIVDRVNSLRPDLIVFTGDLVNSDPAEVEQFTEMLGRLKSRDGVISVLGNHDYCEYKEYKAPDSSQKAALRLMRTERDLGWKLLRNESTLIRHGADSIAVIGVENAGSRAFGDRSDLPKAMTGIDVQTFKVLLSHDPTHWKREVVPTTDIDLTLSGHTHAMQFRIGNWSPSKWVYPEWGGLYDDGAKKLYVSTGVGENVAYRFGAWPQVVLLKLKRPAVM